jgi:DNA-binding response OmpR family regulator
MTTILIIDDDRVILDLLRTVLTDAGYDAVLARGLHGVPPGTKPDIVITDLVPLTAYRRESAVQWIASIRERFADPPLLVMTAHADAAREVDSLGANAVMGKPFDVDVLLAKLDDLLV